MKKYELMALPYGLTVSWNLRSKYEEQKNHSFGKRIVGFLLLCVSAAEATGRFLKRR